MPSDIVDSYLSKYALMEVQRRASLIIDRRTDPKGRKVSRLAAKVHLAGSENTCTLPVLLLALLKTCQLFKSLSLYSCSAHVQCRLLFLTGRSDLLFFVFIWSFSCIMFSHVVSCFCFSKRVQQVKLRARLRAACTASFAVSLYGWLHRRQQTPCNVTINHALNHVRIQDIEFHSDLDSCPVWRLWVSFKLDLTCVVQCVCGQRHCSLYNMQSAQRSWEVVEKLQCSCALLAWLKGAVPNQSRSHKSAGHPCAGAAFLSVQHDRKRVLAAAFRRAPCRNALRGKLRIWHEGNGNIFLKVAHETISIMNSKQRYHFWLLSER